MAKILIVDDSQELLDFFSLLLRMQGYEVSTASSKNKLNSQLPLFSPDLVLLDVMLNGENGREICKEIKLNNPERNIPVILLSANPDTLHDYKECKADDIIEKPFDINTVLQKVNKLLDRPSEVKV